MTPEKTALEVAEIAQEEVVKGETGAAAADGDTETDATLPDRLAGASALALETAIAKGEGGATNKFMLPAADEGGSPKAKDPLLPNAAAEEKE